MVRVVVVVVVGSMVEEEAEEEGGTSFRAGYVGIEFRYLFISPPSLTASERTIN